MDVARRKVIHDAMVRLSDGDRTAFDTLLDELWPVILSFVERGMVSDAEDVAQEVFFKICARVTDFDPARDGLSWAFGIASYEMMTQRRRSKRRREVCDESSLQSQPDGSASQEEVLLQREVITAFQHAVGALTEDDLQALGLAPGGDVKGIPHATLRKRKQRALERLRGLWRSIYGEA